MFYNAVVDNTVGRHNTNADSGISGSIFLSLTMCGRIESTAFVRFIFIIDVLPCHIWSAECQCWTPNVL